MKKILLIGLLSFSFLSFAQKKELRKAAKLLDQSFYVEALNALSQIESLIDGTDQKYQAQFYYLNGWALKGDLKYNESVFNLKKSIKIDNDISLNKYVELSNDLIIQVQNELLNSAIKDNKNEDYKSASIKLYDAYLINPENEVNIGYLFYAAESSVKINEYDKALKYYLVLKKMGYTGVVSEYFVTKVETGIEEKVTEQEYNLFKTLKDYTNFRVGNTESKLPGIVKNIALIYVKKGDDDLAKAAIKEARDNSPDDVGLILTEANLYIRLGDKVKQKELFELAIKMNPDNVEIYWNLGFLNQDKGETNEAMKYFKKCLEMDETYTEAYKSIYNLLLESQQVIRQKMDKIVSSRKSSDLIKYENFVKQLLGIDLEMLSYLERYIKVDPKNIEVIRNAASLYYNTDQEEKRKLMMVMIDELETNQ